jgi:hypothetical protein
VFYHGRTAFLREEKTNLSVELKWDKKRWVRSGRLLEGHAGRVLLAGIGYDKKTKKADVSMADL